MIELHFHFLPQRIEETKWADKEMLTRWECTIIENTEIDGEETLPFTCFAPTSPDAACYYENPWPTSEISVRKEEGSTQHVTKYTARDPKIYDCPEDAFAAAKNFRDEVRSFIKLWKNTYAHMNYKVTMPTCK